jgi:hypothetical protein
MAPDNGTNIPHSSDFEPLLTVDSTVEVQPDNDVYAVDVLEVIPAIETQTFTVSANDTLEEQEITALYVQDGVLAQYRLPDPAGTGGAIPDGVRITVDQGGQESPRFNTKNERGFYSNDTSFYGDAAQQTELFQFENTDLFFNVENTTGSQVTFSLIYSGWAYKLTEQPEMVPEDADQAVLTERSSLRR